MMRASGVLVAACSLLAATARAGNTEDVVAGSDVALTGGAVVANVHTGGAMWFNPAGVARLEARSVDLTGAVLSYNTISAPGALSLSTGAQSEGDFSAVQAIPRALTFVMAPRPSLHFGVGLFFSRSLSRFLQDSVSTTSDAPEQSEFFATADETKSLYHISGAVAWKKSEKFLLGGALDIVVANQRLTEIISGGYLGGAGGTFNRSFNSAVAGGGLQIKGGLQWAPIPRLRVGWMASTPTYLVYLNEEMTETRQIAPPGGTPVFEGRQIDQLRGAWTGVERGLTRVGAAVLGDRWGWVELDVIVGFPLRSVEFDIDWKTTGNVRVGGVFRIIDQLKLGAGFFTDFSPERTPDRLGDTRINFFGATVGIDFSNGEGPPEPGEDGFYFAFAVALRYAHGNGDLAGLLFQPTLSEEIGQLNLVNVKVNEYAINLAFKASF